MKRKSLKVNALLNGMKQVCSIFFPLITFPYISRILGSEGYGKYSFSQSITNYFILLAALGVNTYAIREGAKIREDKNMVTNFCSQVFSINVCSGLISVLLLYLFVFSSSKISSYGVYIFIESTAIAMAVLGTNWINSIYEDYLYLTIQYIVVQIIALISMFIFVRKPTDIIPYCIISVLATSGGNLINLYYVRRYVKVHFTFHMDLRKHFRPLLVLFANSIAITIYVNSDITMLGFFASDSVVGVYSFAAKIYNILKTLINAVIVVSVPRVSYVLTNHKGDYKHYVDAIFAALSLVLLPITVGLFCMSDSMILIAGGEQYISGNSALKILSFATVFAILASLFTNCVLIVNRQEKKCLMATVASAIINVGLNFIFLPILGMIGAALTTIISEMINCFIQMHYSKTFLDWRDLNYKSSLSCILGAVAIVGVCFWCNSYLTNVYIRMGIAIVVSSLVYGFIQIVMKNEYALDVLKKLRTIMRL